MSILNFDSMSFLRNSLAWCPITGKRVLENTPRIINDYILSPVGEPIIYYKFPNTQGFMAYNDNPYCYYRSGETTHYFEDQLDILESAIPGIDRTIMGTSYEGRNIEKFQLGTSDKEHFVVTAVIHGNETDGLLGNMKAFEILCTHPDFAQLRNDYTLVFWPCCNPDGYFAGTRNLAKYGPHPSRVDKTINLNRVWPWFWTEYNPTDDESKGAEPLDCDEAQILYNWRVAGNNSGPISIKFLMDQHSTAGDGARYQSRDRCFRDIPEDDLETLWADWTIFRLQKATQARRVQEDDMPDLWVNYYRSRWKPHWHSWNSTRTADENGGIPVISMVNEYNKVASIAVDIDKETYQSACNYTLDYILSCARIIQGEMTERKSVVLVEHETGQNLANNSEFHQWQKRNDSGDPIDYRPGYWTPSRTTMLSSNYLDRHMEFPGRPIKLKADLLYDVPDGYNVGPHDYHDIKIEDLSTSVFMIVPDDAFENFIILSCDMPSTPNIHTSSNDEIAEFECDAAQQARLVKCNNDAIYFVLLNDSDNVKLYSLIDSGSGFADTLEDTLSGSKIDAATAGPSDSLYIIGGESSVGYPSNKVFTVSTSEITELGTDLLDTADSGFEAIYCSGGTLDGKIIVVGGKAETTESTIKVVVIDVETPSSTEYEVDITGYSLPERLISCGLYWQATEDKLWIYGGKNPDDTDEIYGGIWSLTWNGSGFDVADEEVIGGFDDDGDPEDYSGKETWNSPWSDWRFTAYTDSDDGNSIPIFLGGQKLDLSTELPDTDPVLGMHCHYINDEVFAKPQNYTFGYFRYNLSLDNTSNYVNTSWSYKIPETNNETATYVRINNAPGTDSILTTRRSRTYYLHPPQWWWREHAGLDMSMGRPDYDEDVWRAYFRYYRHNQELFLDAPMITSGSLWPSSWSPYGYTRQSETAYWENVIDSRWFNLSIVWTPSACFNAMISSTRLLRIGESTDNYRLELWAIINDNSEREYVRGMTKGIAEPKLELRSYYDATNYTSCYVPVYWGGYHKDTAIGRFDSPIVITIWQHLKYGSGLIIKNGYTEGWNSNTNNLDINNWTFDKTLYLLGGGYWAEPELSVFNRSFIKTYIKQSNINGALLLGDRDPTYGQVSLRGTFRYTEDFDRDNNINLGSYWDIISQTNNGWDIYNNEARCSDLGWERWDAYPYLRDTKIHAKFRIAQNNSKFGVFQRINWVTAGLGNTYGYLGSLYIDGSNNKYLMIEKITNGTPSTLLQEATDYEFDDTNILTFEAVGDSLTIYLKTSSGYILDQFTTTDSTYSLPGAFGICGETDSGSEYVYLEEIWAEPYSVKTNISE